MASLKQKVASMQVARTIPVVTIKIGTAVRIEIADTDGGFEIHYDSPMYPGKLIVRETEGLPDSYERAGILYCEEFPSIEQVAKTAKPVEVDHLSEFPSKGDDLDAFHDCEELTFAIYWHGVNGYFNKEDQSWEHERIEACEYTDPSLAHAQANKLLDVYGKSEQFKIIRSDEQP